MASSTLRVSHATNVLRATPPFGRCFLAAVSLLLAAGAVVHYVQELGLRGQAQRFVRRFSLDLRRPVDVETMRLTGC